VNAAQGSNKLKDNFISRQKSGDAAVKAIIFCGFIMGGIKSWDMIERRLLNNTTPVLSKII